MKLIKKASLASLFIFSTLSLSAFDWPQKEIMSDTFHTYFGQLRGGLTSPSLVFSSSTDIKTSDAGFVTAVISEQNECSELFDSTLGNAVIVVHKDNMMTVYGNLSPEEQEQRFDLTEVETGTDLGTCGNSGWQEGNALLEFQVVDLKNRAFVNPRILMPRFGNEYNLTILNVTAVNKKGNVFDLNAQRKLASGTYYLYRDRQNPAMPYKTTVLINGAAADSITYDTLIEKEGRLSTSGNNSYPASLVYPDTKKHLLACVNIPKGRNRVSITVTDILGKSKTLTYTIDAF